MKVEILIFAYLAVCASMIVFNIVCIFVFRHRDKKIDSSKIDFETEIKQCIDNKAVDSKHREFLMKKLKKVNNLTAFDKTLNDLYLDYPDQIIWYLEDISSVFVYLCLEYLKKNKIQSAYYPYIIRKYRIGSGKNISIITDTMLILVGDSSLYCRQNALEALSVIGDASSIVKALHIIDESGYYHHSKLISDALLDFSGNNIKLSDLLWSEFSKFSEKMQLSILDFFRFSSGEHVKRVFQLLTSKDTSDEIKYSCIRYLGKFHYDPAYPYLLDYAKDTDEVHWEYTAITAMSLAAYPCEQTKEVLKNLLHSSNWYVRYNASQSLETLGYTYTDLIDIFDGDDRYASEIMRYRLDQKKLKESEATLNDA